MTPKPKTYLGDGVYAVLRTGGMLTLTTEDGISTTNVANETPTVERIEIAPTHGVIDAGAVTTTEVEKMEAHKP